MELIAAYMYLTIRKAGLTMFMYDDFIHRPTFLLVNFVSHILLTKQS
jgi:hypothetical protein